MMKMKNVETFCMTFIWLLIVFCLCHSSSAMKLNLSESCANSNIYFCTLNNITTSYDDPLVIVNASVPQLQELIIFNGVQSGLQLIRLPSGIFEQAPNLRAFTLYNTYVNKVQPRDFEQAHHLQKLTLSRNRLFDIPEKAFISLFALEELHLPANHIHMLHGKAFFGLSKLKYLDLQQNTIVSLPSQLFEPLVHLEHIDLSANFLEKLDANTFASNTKLQNVVLSDNHFTLFEPNTLKHVPRLRLLDVTNSFVDELRLQSVDVLLAHNSEMKRCVIGGSLITMRASKNQLTGVSVGDKTAVRELDLRENRFASLDDIAGMLNLQHLDVSKNQLTSLRTSQSPLYLPLPGLTYLNLAFNQLVNLSSEVFIEMPKLLHLDLAFNNLSHFENYLFKPLLNLEKLYVEGNHLRELDFRALQINNVHLHEIGLSDNKWKDGYLVNMIHFFEQSKVKMRKRFPQHGDDDVDNSTEISTMESHHRGTTDTDSHNKIITQPDADANSSSAWSVGEVLGVIATVLAIIIVALQLLYIWQGKFSIADRCKRNFTNDRSLRTTNHQRLQEADSEI